MSEITDDTTHDFKHCEWTWGHNPDTGDEYAEHKEEPITIYPERFERGDDGRFAAFAKELLNILPNDDRLSATIDIVPEAMVPLYDLSIPRDEEFLDRPTIRLYLTYAVPGDIDEDAVGTVAGLPPSVGDLSSEYHVELLQHVSTHERRRGTRIPTSTESGTERVEVIVSKYTFVPEEWLDGNGDELGLDGVIELVEEHDITAAEALDYAVTELADKYSQSEWARKRGTSQPTVSGNVSQAREKINE